MRTMGFASLLVVCLAAGGCGGGDSETPPTNRGRFGECFGGTGQTCTGVDAYETCVEGQCDAQARDCFGAGYKSGNFSGGRCAAFMTCALACDWGDTSCQAGCAGTLTSDCASCAEAFGSCEAASDCTTPTCTGGSVPDARTTAGGPDGGGACSRLAACCPNGYFMNGLGARVNSVEQRLSSKVTLTERIKAAGHHQIKVGADVEGNYLDSQRGFSGGSFITNFGDTWRSQRFIALGNGPDNCGFST